MPEYISLADESVEAHEYTYKYITMGSEQTQLPENVTKQNIEDCMEGFSSVRLTSQRKTFSRNADSL